ncbi:uncharacterized protein LOC132615851 isoform X1 [Lycium barbarum]|uniref:uncharacterized protein LOC132615851 isoform X1 n=1 Tax=Lycium barbarum TaxID=112863 RepID=UPI00293EFEE6|nr:uncharacterized protein LOC132615851 isoform X1 [Lycium barbarum]
MHLWPSMRLRESFKERYLKNLEWNLHRMDSQKQCGNKSANDQKLLDGSSEAGSCSSNGEGEKLVVICRELLMILSCCYCCFCCGAIKHTCFQLQLCSMLLNFLLIDTLIWKKILVENVVCANLSMLISASAPGLPNFLHHNARSYGKQEPVDNNFGRCSPPLP